LKISFRNCVSSLRSTHYRDFFYRPIRFDQSPESLIPIENRWEPLHSTVLYMVEEPISLSFAFRPRSNIGPDKSAAQSGATQRQMHSRYLPNPNTFKCVASHREAVSTIFKVFGMTRPRVDLNPKPLQL
jgi:hypothetical protein